MSAPEPVTSGARAWMAGVHESGWHAVTVSSRGGSVVTACGHRLYGPVHRRIADDPPVDAVRTVCAACRNAIGYLEPRLFRPRAERIAWSSTDPDARPAERVHSRAGHEHGPRWTEPRQLHPAGVRRPEAYRPAHRPIDDVLRMAA